VKSPQLCFRTKKKTKENDRDRESDKTYNKDRQPKNLSETVAVRGENVKGRDHAVSLVAVIVQQEDVVPDLGN
jgi:hypothetical protein